MSLTITGNRPWFVAKLAKFLGAPTTTGRGGILQAPLQANSTAVDVAGLVVDFNALLTKLKNAGVMSTM